MIESYMLLQSINPFKNRHRIYRVQVLSVETNTKNYIVSCNWGRRHKFTHKRQYTFEKQDQLHRFLQNLLKLRQRHHYSLVEVSEDFPTLPATEEFEFSPMIPQQATLFQ